ncbi:hypothetical protein [Persicobacter psychrovividus]|uniref:Lipoprotein n=1 Tax=Persicobacter psychrovividus TaxID=387638 RepID=A0ABN6LKL5_9BACT|nr:hypothetical protein PEPS_44270 [Persicobacter psychrovividus]
MKKLNILIVFVMALYSLGCSSSYKLMEQTGALSPTEMKEKSLMVLVLYPDEQIESRVALEKSVVDHLRSKDIKAICSYQHLTSVDGIATNLDNLMTYVSSNKCHNLLIFNPIKSIDYNEDSYHNQMGVYRVLDLKTAEFWGSVGALAESAEASRFIYGVSMYDLNKKKVTYQAKYKIKAPAGYDLEYAKGYAKEFVDEIIGDLK